MRLLSNLMYFVGDEIEIIAGIIKKPSLKLGFFVSVVLFKLSLEGERRNSSKNCFLFVLGQKVRHYQD